MEKRKKSYKKLNPKIFHIDYFAENGNTEINTNNSPILRSEYQTISVNGTLNNNVKNYITELSIDNSLKEYASKLEYNYKNNITHDGKPKPKKVDIFKRIKNWFRGK